MIQIRIGGAVFAFDEDAEKWIGSFPDVVKDLNRECKPRLGPPDDPDPVGTAARRAVKLFGAEIIHVEPVEADDREGIDY